MVEVNYKTDLEGVDWAEPIGMSKIIGTWLVNQTAST